MQQSSSLKREFYVAVRDYYGEAVRYIKAKFPLDDKVLIACKVLDLAKREKHKFTYWRQLLQRFPVLKEMPGVSMDVIQQEFLELQTHKLPESILSSDLRVDEAWFQVGQIRDVATAKPKFANISKVASALLVLPHSNANCERLFSLARKNKTEYRSSMSTETLESLLILKMNVFGGGKECYSTELPDDLLTRCKSAAYRHLGQSSAV